MLPKVIETLIHEYREQFERVDQEIQDAINQYHTLEVRAQQIMSDLRETGICAHHLDYVNRDLHRTVEHGSYIVSRILENEEVHVLETELLLALQNEILVTVFNALIQPLF